MPIARAVSVLLATVPCGGCAAPESAPPDVGRLRCDVLIGKPVARAVREYGPATSEGPPIVGRRTFRWNRTILRTELRSREDCREVSTVVLSESGSRQISRGCESGERPVGAASVETLELSIDSDTGLVRGWSGVCRAPKPR